jgi:hypothetical protein
MSIIHSRFVTYKAGCITNTHVNEAPAISVRQAMTAIQEAKCDSRQ